MAAIYTERCAGCHGAGVEGGRAPSLFDATWKYGDDDESIRKTIHDGITGTEMVGFASSLSDQQIWQLVGYLRTQAETLKGKPTYVPDPDGQVIKSEKQTFKIEVIARNIETPWGLAFLPDGRLLDYRTSRPPSHRRERQAPARGRQRHAEGVGETGRRPPRRRSASAVREERVDLSVVLGTVPGYVAPPAHGADAPAAPTHLLRPERELRHRRTPRAAPQPAHSRRVAAVAAVVRPIRRR